MSRWIFWRGVLDTLDLFEEELIRAAREKGHECLEVDATNPKEYQKQILAFAEEKIDGVVSFNQIAYRVELTPGKNLWEELNIPFFNILVDHPFHYQSMLAGMPSTTVMFCIDRKHIEYIKKYFKNINKIYFLPHGGTESLRNDSKDSSNKIPWEDSSIDVLYAGNLSRFVAEGLIPDLASIEKFDALDLCQKALEKLTSQPEYTLEEVVEECLKTQGVCLSADELREAIGQMRFLEAFAVSFFREMAIRTLLDAGIKVDIYGKGWEQCEWAKHPNLRLHEPISPRQVLEKMADSKLVLNTMTWFKDGSHERICNGLLQEAVVVTDESCFAMERWENGKDLCFFSLERISELGEIVKSILNNPTRAKEIAAHGYKKAREQDTWKQRWDEIEQIQVLLEKK